MTKSNINIREFDLLLEFIKNDKKQPIPMNTTFLIYLKDKIDFENNKVMKAFYLRLKQVNPFEQIKIDILQELAKEMIRDGDDTYCYRILFGQALIDWFKEYPEDKRKKNELTNRILFGRSSKDTKWTNKMRKRSKSNMELYK